MTAIPDHYSALGIDPTADQEVIAAAYRALAKKYHPDTGATTGTASPERFAEIQQAYEVLGSVEGRRRYDAELLEATQRELDEHLARKQRKIAGATGEPPPPPPDLGVIRPERSSPKPMTWSVRASLKDMAPFLVVSGLLMAVAGGFATLILSQNPLPTVEEPAQPKPPQPIEAARASPRQRLRLLRRPPRQARPPAAGRPAKGAAAVRHLHDGSIRSGAGTRGGRGSSSGAGAGTRTQRGPRAQGQAASSGR